MLLTTLTLTLPTWVSDLAPPDRLEHLTDRMELVLGLARRNVEQGTGGPFAAAVLERGTGQLVSVGVNRVVPENSSLAHAEVLAIGLAQATLGTYDLGAAGHPRLQLVSTQAHLNPPPGEGGRHRVVRLTDTDPCLHIDSAGEHGRDVEVVVR